MMSLGRGYVVSHMCILSMAKTNSWLLPPRTAILSTALRPKNYYLILFRVTCSCLSTISASLGSREPIIIAAYKQLPKSRAPARCCLKQLLHENVFPTYLTPVSSMIVGNTTCPFHRLNIYSRYSVWMYPGYVVVSCHFNSDILFLTLQRRVFRPGYLRQTSIAGKSPRSSRLLSPLLALRAGSLRRRHPELFGCPQAQK